MSHAVQLLNRPIRMLVVDDENVITFALQTYFEANGYVVHTAAECDAAIAMLLDNEYDVLIADVRLTGTNAEEGLEVVRCARDRSDSVGIVLLTAYGSASITARAMAAGANLVLNKPKPLADIAATVVSLLERRSA